MTKSTGKQEILNDLKRRVDDKILEQSNYDLLRKLVENAESLDEAIKIAELGTTYKRTGFHFDKRLEKQSNTISYFKKNDALSFVSDPKALTHKLIIGDNYPALLNLLIEYKGSIDVIYIDPPYSKDSMGEFARTNYDNALTRDNLLSMLYPRLRLAKQLLSESGVIFCSIDDRNQAYVKGLFDEVFGESNFVGNIVWHKKDNASFLSKEIVNLTEYILFYKKSNNFTGTKDRFIDSSKHRELITKPSKIGERIFDKNNTIVENGNFSGQLKSGKYGSEMFNMEILEDVEILNGIPKTNIKIKGRFCWTQKTIDDEIKEGGRIEIKVIKGMKPVFYKNFGDDVPYRPMLDLLSKKIEDDIATNNDAAVEIKEIFGSPVFEYSKPSKLINKLIRTIVRDNPNAIILDFFAGSGTTGQAVLELNAERKTAEGGLQFILVTNNEVTNITPNGIALDVTSKRLKRVMTGTCYDGSSDFTWNEKNRPLGGNLEVLDMAEVANSEAVKGKTPFDVIDETLYGQKKFKTIKQKVEWVCDHFEGTQKKLEE